MKTKGKLLKITLLLVFMVMVTMSVISGTLAKYVDSVTGTDTATVAKFDYTVTGLSKSSNSISLFDTSSDTGVIGSSSDLIAPGTNGSFTVTLTNASDVAIKAVFDIDETNASDIPIVYTYDSKYYSSVLAAGATVKLHDGDSAITIDGDLSALATAIGDATVLSDTTTTETITIGWAWAFEGVTGAQTDTDDTTLGEAGTATVQVDIECDITQVDSVSST